MVNLFSLTEINHLETAGSTRTTSSRSQWLHCSYTASPRPEFLPHHQAAPKRPLSSRFVSCRSPGPFFARIDTCASRSNRSSAPGQPADSLVCEDPPALAAAYGEIRFESYRPHPGQSADRAWRGLCKESAPSRSNWPPERCETDSHCSVAGHRRQSIPAAGPAREAVCAVDVQTKEQSPYSNLAKDVKLLPRHSSFLSEQL